MARQRGVKWQADAIVNGRRVRPTFATKDQAEAFEKASAQMASLAEATIGKLFPEYGAYLWEGKKDWSNSKSIVNDLIRRLKPETRIFDITDEVVEDLKTDMSEELAQQTVNNKLAKLSKLMKRAQRKKLITALPVIELYPPQEEGRLRFLTEVEEERLLSHLDEQDQHIVRFLVYTGARWGEMMKLEWRDVQEPVLTLYHTKNGRSRSVPLTGPVREALSWSEAEGHDTPFAWVHYKNFRSRLYKARTKAKLGGDVVIHTFRHTCASRLVQRGVDLRRVKDWMGHLRFETTLRYAKLRPDDLLEAASVLERSSGKMRIAS